MWTIFEYLYRDASNFKAHGRVALAGIVTHAEQKRIIEKFIARNLFIAEQIGIPTLYEDLYKWSNGKTDCDHCWHEFVQFSYTRELKDKTGIPVRPNAKDFVDVLSKVASWDESLSPHFCNCGDVEILAPWRLTERVALDFPKFCSYVTT